jgi:hypothetical protein
MTSELRAQWITAIATALQTLAVVATLGVAAVEYFGHKRQDVRTEREAVIKLFTEEPSEVQRARSLAELLNDCIVENKKDPSKGFPGCPNPFPSDFEAKRQLAPLITYLGRVSVCRRTGICEIELSSDLYCTDARNVHTVTARNGAGSRMESRAVYTDYRFSFETCLRD